MLNTENIQNENEYCQGHLKIDDCALNKSLPILIEKKCRCINNNSQNNSLNRSNSIQCKSQSKITGQNHKIKCQSQSDAYFPSPIHSPNHQLAYRISALPQTKDIKK